MHNNTPPNPAAPLTLCELTDARDSAGVLSFSPFCMKVHRALQIAGLPYARRHAHRPDAHKKLNARHQVPVLLVGEQPVADSTAILSTIVALRPAALVHDDAAWLLEEFADTSLNGFLVAARWADDGNWSRTRAAYFSAMPAPVRAVVPRVLRRKVMASLMARDVWRGGAAACWQRLQRVLDHLDARAPVAGFWHGARPGVGDVAVYGQLWSLCTPLTPDQAAMVAARTRLHAYLTRVHHAPALA